MKKLMFIFLFFYNIQSYSQIHFNNPDFEDTPRSSIPPTGWDLCSLTPDCVKGISVYKNAYQGETYLGIQCGPTFPSPSYESAGQKLSCNLIEKKIMCLAYIVIKFLIQ